MVHINITYVLFAEGLDFVLNILIKIVNYLIMEREESLADGKHDLGKYDTEANSTAAHTDHSLCVSHSLGAGKQPRVLNGSCEILFCILGSNETFTR